MVAAECPLASLPATSQASDPQPGACCHLPYMPFHAQEPYRMLARRGFEELVTSGTCGGARVLPVFPQACCVGRSGRCRGGDCLTLVAWNMRCSGAWWC